MLERRKSGFRELIHRRSGRHITDHTVMLPKRARDYKTGEQLTVVIDGREMGVRVEIPIDSTVPNLYIA